MSEEQKLKDFVIEITETLASVNKQNYELQEENRKLKAKCDNLLHCVKFYAENDEAHNDEANICLSVVEEIK